MGENTDGFEIRTGSELKAEEQASAQATEVHHGQPEFSRYRSKNELDFLLKNNPQAEEIMAQEEMWFKLVLSDVKRLEKIKKKILLPADYQKIGNEDWIKKSGVRKIANAFNVTTDVIKCWTEYHDWGAKDGHVIYTNNKGSKQILMHPHGLEIKEKVIVRATRNGWFRNPISGSLEKVERDHQEAVGSCSNFELASKKGQDYNGANIYQTAETRATSRAILNLVGSGKVSSEEILYDNNKEEEQK